MSADRDDPPSDRDERIRNILCLPEVQLRRLLREFLAANESDETIVDRLLTAFQSRSHEDPYATEVTDPEVSLPTQDWRPGSATVNQHAGTDQNLGPASNRYQIVRFHAKGGLGLVYVAYDRELNRQVALKEMRDDYARDQASQMRFNFEAEVTGLLEHPGIVPIYGMGRYEDQRPFYAMRFLDHDNLNSYLKKFHSKRSLNHSSVFQSQEFRSLLNIFIKVCDAVHYAHERGVIHRDIKPENIMVGRYGEAWLVDWGLAKVLARSEPKDILPLRMTSGSGGTVHGSVFGTPYYMSPEQAGGLIDQLTPATDIYSLGAVLFEILTGERTVRASDTTDVLQSVRDGKIRSPREVVPVLPRPLNAICGKAMARLPKDRYQSARELADDLERWFIDERVVAIGNDEPVIEQAGRLMRRYRSWALSIAASLVVVTMVAILSTVLIARSWREENVAKLQATDARTEALLRYRDSRKAIDTWLVGSYEALTVYPGTKALQLKLLRQAVADYAKLSSSPSGDAEIELERVRVLVRLGDLYELMEEGSQARNQYLQAVELLDQFRERLGEQAPMLAADSELENAYVLHRLALNHEHSDVIDEAERYYQRALEIARQVPVNRTSDPVQGRARTLVAAILANYGQFKARLGDLKTATNALAESIEGFRSADVNNPLLQQLPVAQAFEAQARIYASQGDWTQAQRILQQGESLLALVPRSELNADGMALVQASIYVTAATLARRRGDMQAERTSLTSAAELYQSQMQESPMYLGIAQTMCSLALISLYHTLRTQMRFPPKRLLIRPSLITKTFASTIHTSSIINWG